MSPERPATNRQRDQRFWRTLLPDDSQLTASRYAVLWPCHRENMVIAHGWRKKIEEQKKLKFGKKLEFSKKKWIWHELYCIIEIDFELMNSICLFSINDYLLKCLMKSVEKWSLLTGLSSSLPPILLFFYRCWGIKMIQDMNGRVIRSRISILLLSVESLIEFNVRTMNHYWIYWDINQEI